jgi:myo-inositol-1(or 4)-monophosphatase
MKQYENFACHLVEKSAEIIRGYFRTPVAVDTKPDNSPVTMADKQAEEVMRELIMKEYPDHGIIGEELGNHNPDAEYTWVLDPIDGTQNFICGGLSFGTLIALMKDHQPILGVIHQPILNELLIGSNNETRFNGRRVTVRPCQNLSDAVLLTSDPFLVEQYQGGKQFDDLRRRVKLYRCWGDCYGYLLLALGFVDIMIDPIMNIWDSMALIPVIRGAGGTISDYQGNDPVDGTSIIATAGDIHGQVIRILNNNYS